MAILASAVFEIRTTGSSTNGGGFITGATGQDMSQFDNKNTSGGTNCFSTTADLSVTDAVTNGTTTITSATANFSTSIVGNVIYVAGGTGSVVGALYEVKTRTNSTTITVDRTTGLTSGTGVTLNIGGAISDLGAWGAVAVSINNGQTIWIKSGTYNITSASTNIVGGCFTTTTQLHIEGYGSSRGDFGTKPLLQAGNAISTFTVMTDTGAGSTFRNIEVDCASLTSGRAFNVRGSGIALKASNCTNSAYVQTTVAVWQDCVAVGCSGASPFLTGLFVDCIAINTSSVAAFVIPTNAITVRCVAINTSGSVDGFSVTGVGAMIINCVAYGGGRDGIRSSAASVVAINCIMEGNTGVGYNFAGNGGNTMRSCAGYNNSGGNKTATGAGNQDLNFVAGTESFFNNAAGNDFTLNNNAGGGALLRYAGFPGATQSIGTGYADIGPIQHKGDTVGFGFSG